MPKLAVSLHEERASGVVRRIVSTNAAPDVFFECRGVSLPKLELADFAVLATVFQAMRTGRDLSIEGTVSRSLVRNLEEFQEAWSLWRPIYRPIQITASDLADDQTPKDRNGAFAFSGGVDSVFSLLRHHSGDAGLRTCKPAVAVLVHGFDMGLSEEKAFEVAEAGARHVTGLLDVPLAIVRTNWISHLCGEWTSEFGAALAACLHQFSGISSYGIMGADEDYAHLSFPWGSNPVTNHFTSGGSFQILTEGAGFTRTQRVKAIAQRPEIAATLRVCWEGTRTGRNCGKCEKCIRTKLNFVANGLRPVCFADGLPTLRQVATIKPRGKIQRDYLREILSTARANNIRAPWRILLFLAIAVSYAPAILRRLRRIAASLAT